MIIQYCRIDKDQPQVSLEDMCAAETVLTGSAFKLYMYFAYQKELSFLYERVTYVKKCGSNISTANRAFDELVKLGFLKENNFPNYIFYNRSKMVE